MCDDRECHTRVGPKILYEVHHGYQSQGAEETTPEERKKADKAISEHNRNHSMREIIGHPDDLRDQHGYSLVVYEYKAKNCKSG
jgi:hypothetical protein